MKSYQITDTPLTLDLQLYTTPTLGFELPYDLSGCRVSFAAWVLGEVRLELTEKAGLHVSVNDPEPGRSCVRFTDLGAAGRALAREDERVSWDLRIGWPDGSYSTPLRGLADFIEGRP